jgi:hypothetical protein
VTELARRESKVPVAFGVPLRSLDEAYRLSQNLSVAAMLPNDLRGKPADVLAMLLYGQELGLGPMQSIQSIYVVKGRPSLSAQLWRALALRAGHKIDATVEHNKKAAVTVTRVDDPKDPYTAEYTIDDAIQGGRVTLKDGRPYARSQKGERLTWETDTDSMLIARATTKALRFKCPEVALGFYSTDEAQEIADREDEVADAEVIIPQPAPAPQDDDAVDAELVALNAAADEPSEDQLQAFAFGGADA